MRRKEREITERSAQYAILDEAAVMRVALWDGEEPYALPLNFVRVGDDLFFHSAQGGRKIEILRGHPRVCFVAEGESRIDPGLEGGDCTTVYESVIGWGTAVFVTDRAEKSAALSALNRKFGAGEGPFPPALVERTAVVRIPIEKLSGKANRGKM